MSSSSRKNQQGVESKTLKHLQAAEAAYKPNTQTFTGNGSRTPIQSKPLKPSQPQLKKPYKEESVQISPKLKRSSVKKKSRKWVRSEVLLPPASTDAGGSRSTTNQVTRGAPQLGTQAVPGRSLSDQVEPRAQKAESASSTAHSKDQPTPGSSKHEGQSHKVQLETLDSTVGPVREILCVGKPGDDIPARLLRKLDELSLLNFPSSKRLSMCSDVFDDVCESLPTFRRILREIKVDYDLYVNHLMSNQCPDLNMSLVDMLEDESRRKKKERELEVAEKEIKILEQQAARSLEEYKRLKARHKFQNILATLNPEDDSSEDSPLLKDVFDPSDMISCKWLEVYNVWKDVQLLNMGNIIKNHIHIEKAENLKLIATNHRLKVVSQELKNNINVVLQVEKASKATKRMLWDEISGKTPEPD